MKQDISPAMMVGAGFVVLALVGVIYYFTIGRTPPPPPIPMPAGGGAMSLPQGGAPQSPTGRLSPTLPGARGGGMTAPSMGGVPMAPPPTPR